MAKLTLSLGSNLGDRQQLLADARAALAAALGPLTYVSDVHETAAWGYTAQPAFLNQVVQLITPATTQGPTIAAELHRLLDHCQRIESELGRVRSQHWGPRTIDIDLIFVDDLIYEDERISLPHPWWRQRPFVRELLPTESPDPHVDVLNHR